MKTNRTNSSRQPEVLVTLHFPATYLQKDFLLCDATCRQELEMLNLSYTSKNARFAQLKSMYADWYLCPRAHKLGLYKAQAYILKLIAPDSNLICYLRKYNPKIVGYGWSKAGTESVNRRLRKHFMAAIIAGKTEISLFIPEKLLQEGYDHGAK